MSVYAFYVLGAAIAVLIIAVILFLRKTLPADGVALEEVEQLKEEQRKNLEIIAKNEKIDNKNNDIITKIESNINEFSINS